MYTGYHRTEKGTNMNCIIIGIAGGTGSGKSTFTRRLKEEFENDVAVIYHDNYYRRQDEISFEDRKKVNYDHPDSLETQLLLDHLHMLKDGQAIGIGAGQQSRVHCTRLAGQKADNWYLRQAPQVLGLQFIDKLGRADRDNAIDVYIGEEYEDVLREGEWQQRFKVKPPVFTREEKRLSGGTVIGWAKGIYCLYCI